MKKTLLAALMVLAALALMLSGCSSDSPPSGFLFIGACGTAYHLQFRRYKTTSRRFSYEQHTCN